MSKIVRIAVVVCLVALVGGVIILKEKTGAQPCDKTGTCDCSQNCSCPPNCPNRRATTAQDQPEDADAPLLSAEVKLPRLVDLGAGKCTMCKMMTPILKELKEGYAEQLQVEYIDVRENPDEAEKYRIRIIPTQIFFDSAGKELFRHEGFFAMDDILAKWKELGYDLTAEDRGIVKPAQP